jgi:hypothetical protein
MSFLSRRNSRPDRRGGRADAGRRAETDYDDYGYDYAPDDYQNDDNWSPDEYFSPEGIKGRWAAGAPPADRPGDRGRHADGRGYAEPGAGYDDYGSQRTPGPGGGYGPDSYHDAYGQDSGTGDDAYGTGGYDVPEGAEDDQSERSGGRRRRDRGERGDRRRRLGRRDKGDDIWPDDGVSDEDYWASVTAERPLASASGALDADPLQAADNRPLARPAGPAGAAGPVSAAGSVSAARPASASRPAAESRTGSGRLGPPPGLNGYPSRRNSGPMPRPVTGPNAARPAAGLAQPAFPQQAPIQPGAGPAGPPQPSFHPTGSRGASRQPERPHRPDRPERPERPDWTERTERMDPVSSTGYPDPRTSGRGQPAPPAPASPAPPRGRGDSADRRLPDRRDLSREPGRTSGGWPSADDDPLTSKAFSRSALVDTDGRSYRAAHRSQVPADRRAAALTEQTQTFGMNGQFQADPQAPTASYPAYNGQQPGQQSGQRQPGRPTGQNPVQQPRQPVQSPPYDRGATSSYPYPSQPYPSRPVLDSDEERYGRPPRAGGGNGHGGYPSGNGARAGYGRGNGDNRGGR